MQEKIDCVHLDARDHLSMGEKLYEWEKKGVPVRIEVGPRDIENNSVVVVRRDTSEKEVQGVGDLTVHVKNILLDIQKSLHEKAQKMLNDNSFYIDDYEEFKKQLEKNIPGFIYAHWCENEKCEEQIKEETKASTRCFPFDGKKETGKCIKCNGDSNQRIIFAKAY